jgi:hypothetical protein
VLQKQSRATGELPSSQRESKIELTGRLQRRKRRLERKLQLLRKPPRPRKRKRKLK